MQAWELRARPPKKANSEKRRAQLGVSGVSFKGTHKGFL